MLAGMRQHDRQAVWRVGDSGFRLRRLSTEVLHGTGFLRRVLKLVLEEPGGLWHMFFLISYGGAFMSADIYLTRIEQILNEIKTTQMDNIRKAGACMAACLLADGRVYVFGSGHSVIPVMDIFPRYGSFVGFFPLYDPRLMWSNVIGPGGVRELLWLERQEGYASVFLQSYPLEEQDCMLVFSHGGINAAPVEVALRARERGLTVVTVSSHQNARAIKASHSSGKKLPDLAHIAIDNCVPPEDALVDVGRIERVAAGSTVAAVSIAMALVAETASCLAQKAALPPTFVSPNVTGVPPSHMEEVYQAFTDFYHARRRKSSFAWAKQRGSESGPQKTE
jgi:uncharacterized phosphosugar-binding protein